MWKPPEMIYAWPPSDASHRKWQFFQMDWVCGDSWKAPLTQGIHFAGGAVGTLLFGLFADRYGRLPRYWGQIQKEKKHLKNHLRNRLRISLRFPILEKVKK